MTARDSGRYYPLTDTVSGQNVKIDFAWGNMPLQPNDDRGMAQLDPSLDGHVIATNGYEGFPAFITGYPYDDTVPNVTVPNLVGLTNATAAQAALTGVGLVLGDTNPSTVGATPQNNNKVKAQSVTAGSLVNLGETVDIVVYNNPTAAVPNLSGLTPSVANAAITAAGFIVGSTSGTVDNAGGATAQNHGQVATQSPAANTQATIGSTVDYTTYSYVNPGVVINLAAAEAAGAVQVSGMWLVNNVFPNQALIGITFSNLSAVLGSALSSNISAINSLPSGHAFTVSGVGSVYYPAARNANGTNLDGTYHLVPSNAGWAMLQVGDTAKFYDYEDGWGMVAFAVNFTDLAYSDAGGWTGWYNDGGAQFYTDSQGYFQTSLWDTTKWQTGTITVPLP